MSGVEDGWGDWDVKLIYYFTHSVMRLRNVLVEQSWEFWLVQSCYFIDEKVQRRDVYVL